MPNNDGAVTSVRQSDKAHPVPASSHWARVKSFYDRERLWRKGDQFKRGWKRCERKWVAADEWLERQWARFKKSRQSITYRLERFDARYGIPRPAGAPHLPAYHAAVYCLGIAGQMAAVVIAGLISAAILWKCADWLEVSGRVRLIFILVMIIVNLLSAVEALQLIIPFRRSHQRATYGTAQWGEISYLRDLNLARAKERGKARLEYGELRLGNLGSKHELVLPAEQVLCHTAIFGPPGAGKSATFFMHMLRDWSASGSVIVLDPKGELYEQTAYCYQHIYRLDLQHPEISDRWNFVPACKDNAELAHEVSSIILGVDRNKHSHADPFWQEAETAALTAILLYLAKYETDPTPARVQEFISRTKLEDLNRRLAEESDSEIATYWGMFTKIKPETQGSVLIGLGVRCQAFSIPAARQISQPISMEDRKRGVEWIDLAHLRRPGTAIYVCIAEGDASRYKTVLATFFGLASSTLRKSNLGPKDAPVLFVFDEAGNIPIHSLKEMLGVGRGRKIGLVLGYQNLGQVYAQYGNDGGDAVLGSIGAMLFLPGLDYRTSQYASHRIGQATVWQHTSVDVLKGNKFDSERTTEVGRALADASELRRMIKHRQGVAIIGNAPAVRFSFCGLARVPHPPPPPREVKALPTEKMVAPDKSLKAEQPVAAAEALDAPAPQQKLLAKNRPIGGRNEKERGSELGPGEKLPASVPDLLIKGVLARKAGSRDLPEPDSEIDDEEETDADTDISIESIRLNGYHH